MPLGGATKANNANYNYEKINLMIHVYFFDVKSLICAFEKK